VARYNTDLKRITIYIILHVYNIKILHILYACVYSMDYTMVRQYSLLKVNKVHSQ